MLVSQRRIRIEYSDCDPAGIVFYPQYVKMFDVCTTTLFKNAGLSLPDLFRKQEVLGIPLVMLEVRFLVPATFGDDLLAESTVTRWGKSSFVIRHRLSKREKLAVEGSGTHVWTVRDPVNPARLKSRALPREIVERLSVPRTVVTPLGNP